MYGDQNIEGITTSLIEAIRSCPDYLEYKRSAEELGQNPELEDKLMSLRKKTIGLYDSGDEDTLIAESESLGKQYDELRKNLVVNSYLESEEAILRLLRYISGRVMSSMELHTPES